MKKIIIVVIFLLGTHAFALTNSEVTFKAYKTESEYIHANQDMYVYIDTTKDDLILNLGKLVTITANVEGVLSWRIAKGADQLLEGGTSVTKNGNIWIVKYVVRGDKSFVQNQQYVVTVDVGDGVPLAKTVTFNKQFVIRNVKINANNKYQQDNWFKAGLDNISYSDANLRVTGEISYRYETEVFPSNNVLLSIQLFVSSDMVGIASVGNNGRFSFTNFSLPFPVGDHEYNIKISVDIDDVSETLLYLEESNNNLLINIDNEKPQINNASLVFENIIVNAEGVLPVAGYFSQTSVTFSLDTSEGSPHDDYSGVSNNIWVVDQINLEDGFFTNRTSSFSSTFEYNGIPLQGSREVVIYLFDNVFNYTTMSIWVTIDVDSPQEFSVTVLPDLNNQKWQITPDAGWYNNPTVSFSWEEPVDAGGIMGYQFKSEGWSTWSALVEGEVVLYASQNQTQAWVTVNPGGDTSRKIWIRAFDKAGNSKTAYTTVKVDISSPTVSLQLAPDLTGKEDALVNILPRTGWYNDVNIKWFISAEDDGQLREKPYQYKYYYGDSNSITSDWTQIVSEKIVTLGVDITKNVFMVRARDKAGNVGIATAQVLVDFEPPVPTNFRISFDVCSLVEEGVTPEAKWYNKTTVSFVITWDSVEEKGELHRLMLYIGQASSPHVKMLSEQSGLISFNNISVIPNNANPINFKVFLVDKAGNFAEINDFIYSDIIAPNDFTLVLADDSDSGNDGLNPLSGYYDNPNISFMIMIPQADPTVRNRPFQFKVNNNPWSATTSNMYISNFAVSENTCNVVEARYIDKAGNVLTKSFRVTVDTKTPLGEFELVLSSCNYVPSIHVTPDSGWYNQNIVSFQFYVEYGKSITDTFDIRENGFYLKRETDTYFVNGQNNSQNATIYLENAGALQRTIIGAIADKAGNIIWDSAKVFVDTDFPATNFEARILPDSSSGANGIWPQEGWNANPEISIEWDQASDGAGALHDNPYRLKSDGTPTWSNFQYQRTFSKLYVSPNNNTTQNIYIQIRDKAGNIATKSVACKIDIISPDISLFVSPQARMEGVTYNIFYNEYSGLKFPLRGWFNTENITLTWSAFDLGGFPDKSFRVKASSGQTFYGVSLDNNLNNETITVVAEEHDVIELNILAWDNAGNSKVATVGAYVDLSAPSLTIDMKSNSQEAPLPFVNSSDVLYITINVSEPIIVTPFVYYTVSGDLQKKVTIDNVQGANNVWYCTLNISSVEEYGDHFIKILLIDNAGNIATEVKGNSKFIKLTGEQVALPINFYLQDALTERTDLTNADAVKIFFTVGITINKYLILEENLSQSDVSVMNFNELDENDYVVSENEKKCEFMKSFEEEILPEGNGLRTLYLWLKDNKDQITETAVICTINQDIVAPKIVIYQDKNNPNNDDNLRLSKTVYTAEMIITHDSIFEGFGYFESLSVTPDWSLRIDRDGGVPVTTSKLLPIAQNEDNEQHMSVWRASYNLKQLLAGEGGVYFEGIFEVRVTDQAGNMTNYIYKGGRFIVDSNSPQKPIFYVKSLDGKSNYTNSLNVICVISKNVTEDAYYYYSVFDNYSAPPRIDDLIDWEKENFEYKISFSFVYSIQDTSQGLKDIYAWVANSDQQNSLYASIQSITYDSVAPTYEIFIQPLDEEGNEIVVTVCFSEMIDFIDNNKICIEKKDAQGGFSQLSSANFSSFKKVGNKIICVATFDKAVIGIKENVGDKYISINFIDLAGNRIKERAPFSRELNVLLYENYFDRAYSLYLDGEQSYDFSGYQDYNLQVGKKNIPVILAEIKAASKNISLSGVNLSLENMSEAVIEKIYIYLDQDSDGLFDKEQDQLLASKIYSGTGRTMQVNFSEIVVNNQITSTIFVVVDVHPGASEESPRVGFGFVTNNPFIVSYYENVNVLASYPENGIIASFSITGVLFNVAYIAKSDEALSVTRDVYAGSRVPVKKFALRSFLAETAGDGGLGSEGARWTALTVKLNALFSADKITRVAVYKDNGNQIFDTNDQLISNGTDRISNLEEATLRMEFPYPMNVGGADPEVFLVIDLDKSLESEEFSLEIVDSDWFEFRGLDKMIDIGEFPVRTITFNVKNYVSQINVETIKNPARYVYQGSEINVMKINLNLDFKVAEQIPALFSLDLLRDEGNILFGGDIDIARIKLYRYSGNLEDGDFSYTTDLGFTAALSEQNRVRLSIGGGVSLATENRFALVIPFLDNATVGRYGVFNLLFVNDSGYINFGEYGVIENEMSATTNRIEIVSRLQPTKPEIFGNPYSASHRRIVFSYSTTVNVNNQGVDALRVKIGTSPGNSNIYFETISVNTINSKNVQNETVTIQITDSDKFLRDDTSYYVSVQARAGGGEYWSITGDYSFHTDFTPPWVGSSKLSVIAKWDEQRHDVVWNSFTENESAVNHYILEMIAGQSLHWEEVATINSTEKLEWINYNAMYDTPYQYRIKAVNLAGLHSEYLDSGERIMSTNTKEILFNVSNYPNPFYSSFQTTRIVFSLNQDVDVIISIYDSLGHFVRRFDGKDITKESAKAGSGYFCYVDWDGRNESGQFVSKGGYFAVIEVAPIASGGKATKIVRMIGVIH